MISKRFLILGFALLLAAGVGSGWFLFQQSAKLKDIGNNHGQAHQDEIRKRVVTETVNATSLEDIPITSSSEQLEESTNASEETQSLTWVERSLFRPHLVQDVAELLVAHYHPPGSPGCPEDAGMIQMSVKTLNARYGIEFLNVHAPETGVKKARRRIFKFVLQPSVLQRLYKGYAPKIIDAMHSEAAEFSRRSSGGERAREETGLSRDQTAQMFSLYADYFRDVGRVLGVFGRSESMAAAVKEFLQAEKKATQASFVLKKRTHATDSVSDQEVQGQGQAKADALLADKVAAADSYRQALRHREKSKERILQQVRAEVPDMGLPNHEILYVAKWVHRRLTAGEDGQALGVAADLLRDFASRMESRAQEVSPSQNTR